VLLVLFVAELLGIALTNLENSCRKEHEAHISRIHEYWLTSNRTPANNDESVALGVAHTGRVITAAALVMSISFAAMIAAQVSFMRMFGLGLTLAILGDATLVRMLLVPAFMRIMGRFNWWAPKPLARLHKRFPISSEFTPPSAPPRPGTDQFRLSVMSSGPRGWL